MECIAAFVAEYPGARNRGMRPRVEEVLKNLISTQGPGAVEKTGRLNLLHKARLMLPLQEKW